MHDQDTLQTVKNVSVRFVVSSFTCNREIIYPLNLTLILQSLLWFLCIQWLCYSHCGSRPSTHMPPALWHLPLPHDISIMRSPLQITLDTTTHMGSTSCQTPPSSGLFPTFNGKLQQTYQQCVGKLNIYIVTFKISSVKPIQ